MRRWIALALCLCMLAALVGCGGGQPKEDTAPPAAEETAGTDTEETADAPAAEPGLGYGAYAPDTVVATVDGTTVTWEEYFYWLNYYTQYVQMLALQNNSALTSWDAHELSSENTNGQVVLLNAQYAVIQYHTMEAMAAELGYALDETDRATLQAIYEQNADGVMGDSDGVCTEEEAANFEAYLAQQNVSRAFFDYLNEVSLLNEKAFVGQYGAAGELVPEEEILAFAQDAGIVAAKHILLLTVDMATGEALSDEEIAQKRETIDGLYEQLAAVADDQQALSELFDALTAEYTEDTGYAYTYVPGVMVTEFEDAVNAMEEYGLSPVVESDYGYHIIMRIPVTADDTVVDISGQTVNLRAAVANELFADVMNGWMDEADVVWSDGFEDLDVASIFGSIG